MKETEQKLLDNFDAQIQDLLAVTHNRAEENLDKKQSAVLEAAAIDTP